MHAVKPSYDHEAFYLGNPIQKWWKARIANTVWEWLPAEMAQDHKILDIGGGTSPIIQAYSRAWSVDIDYNKVTWNRQNGHSGIQNLQQDAACLTFKNEAFDFVLCIEVLEHIPNYPDAIREIARVLKPGGKAIIATPDYSSWRWRTIERLYMLLMPDAYCSDHVSKLNRDILVNEFGKHGMQEWQFIKVAGADYVGMFHKR